jgi:hypothetical protein
MPIACSILSDAVSHGLGATGGVKLESMEPTESLIEGDRGGLRGSCAKVLACRPMPLVYTMRSSRHRPLLQEPPGSHLSGKPLGFSRLSAVSRPHTPPG